MKFFLLILQIFPLKRAIFSKLYRIELTKNNKYNFLGDDNRLFELCPIFRTLKPHTSYYQPFFLRIKKD